MLFYMYDMLVDLRNRTVVTVVDVSPHGFKVEDDRGRREDVRYPTVAFAKVGS
jgi:hypothetical protein